METGVECEAIAGLEARGFLIGPPCALKLGVPFVPIRKNGKLPGDLAKISYTLEYGEVSQVFDGGDSDIFLKQ